MNALAKPRRLAIETQSGRIGKGAGRDASIKLL
jgi:hypothetical protein